MAVLFSGSGAQDFEVLDDVFDTQSWARLKGLAVRLLRQRNRREAAEILERIPFRLCDGSNGFGDEFAVLYWAAPMEKYVESSEWSEDGKQRAHFQEIAKVVGETSSSYVRFVYVDLDRSEGPQVVESPTLVITSEVVERALQDATSLIQNAGPVSAVDRVHTAMHGYLKAVCDAAGIDYPEEPSITKLFRLIREEHPAFAQPGAHGDAVRKVLMPLASIFDSMNTIRNEGSLAHPTDALIGESEAMLLVNAARTLLHYLNAKLR